VRWVKIRIDRILSAGELGVFRWKIILINSNCPLHRSPQ